MTKMEKQNAKSVQGTNDSSIVSKLSMINKGYFEDSLLHNFVKKSSRRSPLINRGYYIRAKAIEHTLFTFLHNCRSNLQVLSLGAGFDSSYFRISARNEWPNDSTYYEVDFPEVVRRKANLIRSSEDLFSHVKSTLSPPSENENVVLISESYKLIGVDIRNLNNLQSTLEICGINKQKPTLILLECVRTYLDCLSSVSLLKWITNEFDNAVLASYEQMFPDDGFGIVMMKHFLSLGSPLHSIHKEPSIESYRQIYLNLGWKNCSIINMNDFYNFLEDEERMRVEELELFDEYEEWHLKCNHYILIWATKGNIPYISLTNFSRVTHERKKFKWQYLDDFKDIQRFGHSTATKNCQIIVIGGFGNLKDNGGHKRLSDITVINVQDKTSNQITFSHDSILGCRMYSTLNTLNSGLLILLGGRTSPSQAFNDVISLPFENGVSLAPKLITCFGNPPSPRWRHSASVVTINAIEYLIVFGGKTTKTFCTNDCFSLNISSWSWQKIPVSNLTPPARHSHSSVTYVDQLIITCGLSANKPLNCVHILNCNNFQWRQESIVGLIPRYSHTSHVWRNKLFLIGGVNCAPEKAPGVAVIDLKSWICSEFELDVMNPNRPILFHNHSSELDESSGEIYVVGGGGNCFSFGTHLNEGIETISLEQFF